MPRLMLAITALFHFAAPVGLAAWLAWSPPDSRLYLLARLALVIPFFGLLWTGGAGWHIFGTVFRYLVGAIVLVGVIASLRWWAGLSWWAGGIWPQGVLVGGWLLVGIILTVNWVTLIGGGQPPEAEQIDLVFPLRDGDFYAVWGGSHPATNRHLKILDSDKADQYRGQAYAHDIVELNWLGARASGLQPTDPADYEIFGARVTAPCAGEVLRAVDDRPDVDAPTPDDGPPAGNHVFLACDDYRVLLAHLQQDSLEVSEGDQVDIGDPIGRIGNSGNTTEPHLHIHAQRPAPGDNWMAGDPLTITFDSEFFEKGSVISR